jgi:fused signal recognition particle receptor
MFKFLKEKLENWTKNLAKNKEEKREKKEEKAKEKRDKKIKKQEKKENSKIKEVKKEKGLDKKEEDKESFFEKISFSNRKIKISQKEFEKYKEELEFILLENNVALEVVDKIIKNLEERIIEKEIPIKEIEKEIKKNLKEIIEEILISPKNLIEEIKENKKPYVILFCGINGTGKTTTIAKIAYLLKKEKISCVIAAADTFRAASIEQLKKHSENLEIKLISHNYGDDPASVGFDAIKYAEKNKIDCVLIDTAGRMHTQKNLLMEIEKISRVCNPNKKIFVGESITGNNSIEQVKSFDEIINLDNIILTKADIDEKGGTALSLGYITKKPILFIGTGQEYGDLELFDKNKFIKSLGLD